MKIILVFHIPHQNAAVEFHKTHTHSLTHSHTLTSSTVFIVNMSAVSLLSLSENVPSPKDKPITVLFLMQLNLFYLDIQITEDPVSR